MKRNLALFASCSLLATALAATPAAAQQTTLNVVTAGDQNMVDYIKDYLGPMFEKKYPGVKVNAVGTGPGDGGSQKIYEKLDAQKKVDALSEQRLTLADEYRNALREADSRIEKATRSVPAVSWDHDFESVGGRVHLPPGWRLLHAFGVDRASPTWIAEWDLLDLFLLLIIAVFAGLLCAGTASAQEDETADELAAPRARNSRESKPEGETDKQLVERHRAGGESGVGHGRVHTNVTQERAASLAEIKALAAR